MPKDIRFGVRELLVCEVIDSFKDQAPSEFFCPISLQSMRRPVKCSDGFVYEHVMIQKWCAAHDGEGLPSSPMTRASLQPKHVAHTKLMHRMRSWVRTQLALENADKDAFVTSMRAFLGKSADDVMDVDKYCVVDNGVQAEYPIRQHFDDRFSQQVEFSSTDLLRINQFQEQLEQRRRDLLRPRWDEIRYGIPARGGYEGVQRLPMRSSSLIRRMASRRGHAIMAESDFFNY